MIIKPYWVLVTGFVVVLLYVIVLRVPAGRRPYRYPTGYLPKPSPWLGPGGTKHLLGYEGFADAASVFTMFGVDWCPHCVKAKPLFESLGSTVTIGGHNVALRYVNPEKDKEGAAGYEIEGYPTFYLDHNGQKMKHTGPRTKDGFLQFLQSNLGA